MGHEVLGETVALDACERSQPTNGAGRKGRKPREEGAAERLEPFLSGPWDLHPLQQSESRRSWTDGRRKVVAASDKLPVESERIEAEEQRLGPRQRAVRTDVPTFTKRDESCSTRVHVTTGVTEGERGYGKVREQ